MSRVVVTGIGIVSSLGNNREEVLTRLRSGTSGIVAAPEYAEVGLRTGVHGAITLDVEAAVDRRLRRFMGNAAAYAYVALEEAIKDAGLSDAEVSSERTGLVAGSGGASTENLSAAIDLLRARGLRKVSPFMVPRTMSSTVAACLATGRKIHGVSYSISAACATSAHCIGTAAQLIHSGAQDVMFAGGGEEVHWSMSMLFDAMGALSSADNATPTEASRPYDVDRDGFVISGGGGIVVLESLERARARGARIYAELVGYGATSDGTDMVQPNGEGAVRCMRQALAHVREPVDYVNTHGTATPIGDIVELNALRTVFGDHVPPLSSTKALTGHALGAASVHEAVYCLLMMQHNFMAGSHHIRTLDPRAEGFPVIRETRHDVPVNTVLSNSFGFGGTNASLVFRRVPDGTSEA